MKRISFFIVLMVVVFMCTPTYAWKFTLYNYIPTENNASLYQKITCDVYGEHLFWRDRVDCTVRDVGKDSSASCDAGPGICPVALACRATNAEGGTTHFDWTYIGAKCWDVTLRVYVSGTGAVSYLDGQFFTPAWHK